MSNPSDVDPQAYQVYYKRLYPFKSIFHWVNHQHNPTRLFTHREWAFTLPGEVYLRWNSFNTVEDLKKDVIRYNPSRFEVGAVYSAKPRDKKIVRANQFAAHLRELVFDIDMTDYDEIRTCCKGKGICKRCWGFIASAVDVLDRTLREEFGYKHLLWVFSGRRGIHCWISDQAAMALSDDARKALLNYLELIKGGDGVEKRVHTRWGKTSAHVAMHPMLQEALDTTSQHFADLVLQDQDCFSTKEGWEKLIALLPPNETELIKALQDAWEDEATSSVTKWAELKSLVKKTAVDRKQVAVALEEIVLQYMYPRLDSEVTKKRGHLLKAPFCIHPNTGNVCVPIDPANVHEFDPTNVPTIQGLIKELDALPPADPSSPENHHPDWEQTSLKPYVQMLDKHVSGLLRESRQENKAAAARSLDF